MASEPDPCFRMLPALFFLFQTSIFSLVVSIERCAAQQIVCCQLSLHPGFWMSHRLGLCNACSSGRPACDESQSPIHSVMQPGAGTALAPANTYRCPPMEEDTSTKPWTVGFYVGRVGCTECCFCRDILVLWAWRLVGHNWHVQERGPTENTRLNNSPPQITPLNGKEIIF